MVTVKVKPASSAVGVQLKMPPVVMVAPEGAPASSENVRTSEASGSDANAVKVSSTPSEAILLPIGDNTLGSFIFAIVTVKS